MLAGTEGTERIAELFIRKGKGLTRDRVCPVFGVDDLDSEAFEYMRSMIKVDNSEHQWLSILLFGKQNTIASVLPQYYIEDMQRFSLRDKVLREVVLNLLIHRKNSMLANVFSQIGIVEELGGGNKSGTKSGTKSVTKLGAGQTDVRAASDTNVGKGYSGIV